MIVKKQEMLLINYFEKYAYQTLKSSNELATERGT